METEAIDLSQLDFESLDKRLLSLGGVERPRIIHQIWFGTIPDKKRAAREYQKLEKYRDSWTINNRRWCRVEWNKKMCRSLIKIHFPQHLEMYDSYPYEIQRCDAVRACILYRYGGLYADMDYYCCVSFDKVLEKYRAPLYLVQTPNRVGDYVSNSLMYSTRSHPFWLSLLIDMELKKTPPIYYSRHLAIMFTAGPGILNRNYQRLKDRYRLRSYPCKYFQPFGTSDDIMNLKIEGVYTIHASKGCWHSNDSAVIVVLVRNWIIFLFLIIVLLGVNIGFCIGRRG